MPSNVNQVEGGSRRRTYADDRRQPAPPSRTASQPEPPATPITPTPLEANSLIPEWEPPPGQADIASAATSSLTDTADKPIQTSSWTLTELSREAFEQTVQRGGPVAPTGDRARDIINYARQFIGTPYKWGGTGPLGFDCSGLLQYVYRQFGVNLPRVSYQQANTGTRVSFDQAAAGDLWFIDNSSRNNGADHIALYLGNGQILEAPRAGLNVRIRTLSQAEIRRGGFTRVL